MLKNGISKDYQDLIGRETYGDMRHTREIVRVVRKEKQTTTDQFVRVLSSAMAIHQEQDIR